MEDARLRGHVRALDGVRGLAVLMVLGLHFIGNMEPTTPLEGVVAHAFIYGTLGVDLFFVLSGFLITGILVEAKGSTGYFRNFYMRRALRIFPLYYGVLAVVFFIAPLIPPLRDPSFSVLQGRQLWAWLYGVNIFDAIQGALSFRYIDHFWSLAVEEHFYFFWPLIVWLCPKRTLLGVSAGIALASRAARATCASLHVNVIAIDVLTPFRLDALCFGGFLAVAARGPGGLNQLVRALKIGAPAAALLLACLYAFNRVTSMWTLPLHEVRTSLFAVLFGSMIVASVATPPERLLSRIFRSKAMVSLGKYSYGLYVLHHFFSYYFMSHRTEFVVAGWVGSHLLAVFLQAAVGLGLSIVATRLSFRFFEKPFLEMKRLWTSKPAPADALVAEAGASSPGGAGASGQ